MLFLLNLKHKLMEALWHKIKNCLLANIYFSKYITSEHMVSVVGSLSLCEYHH